MTEGRGYEWFRAHSRVLVLTLALSAPLLPGSVAAATVELRAIADNTMYETTGAPISNGSGEHLFAGMTRSRARRRALIRFDPTGAIPRGSTVTSVVLTLQMTRTISGATPVALHFASRAWGEGTSDATGDEGGGTPATLNDATWLHTFFSTAFWTSQGGDFAPVARATTTVSGDGSYTWSSPGMSSDVQSWLDTPQQNSGWVLIGDETRAETAKRFSSRENLITNSRPLLVVTFTPVVPRSGDATGDGQVNVADVFYLINSLFTGGPAPVTSADVDGNGVTNVADVFYLIHFLFAGGPVPR